MYVEPYNQALAPIQKFYRMSSLKSLAIVIPLQPNNKLRKRNIQMKGTTAKSSLKKRVTIKLVKETILRQNEYKMETEIRLIKYKLLLCDFRLPPPWK
jgi:hypothetical protein